MAFFAGGAGLAVLVEGAAALVAFFAAVLAALLRGGEAMAETQGLWEAFRVPCVLRLSTVPGGNEKARAGRALWKRYRVRRC
jgi:hypothetical protein